MELGIEIRKARKTRGLALGAVYAKFRTEAPPGWEDVALNTLHNWETGKTQKVDALALPALAEAMGLEPGYFFDRILDAYHADKQALRGVPGDAQPSNGSAAREPGRAAASADATQGELEAGEQRRRASTSRARKRKPTP